MSVGFHQFNGILPVPQIVATVAATVPARCFIFARVD